MKKIKIIAVLIGLLIGYSSFSQGDDCSTALQLTTLKDYCSTGGLYTNATATAPGATGFAQATCWTNATQNIDVWFKFVSVGTDVMITVKGAGLSTGATLNQASIALYSGDCATSISEHKCTESTSSNVTSMYQGALDLAKTYYIRVTTTSANKGKFDLCINNFNPVQNPNSPNDCDKGTIICNKDLVSVGLLDSYGSNRTEHQISGSCMSSSTEANSTWLEFKCSTSGTLDFDLSGTDIYNDLDWILMEIPAIRNCATKTLLSCNNASCDINRAQSSSNVERRTGLRAGEAVATLNAGTTSANSEDGGCASPANGYNNTLNITAGKSYALFINNFTGVQGFAITWGGTSKFQGPEPAITVDKTTICIGESIQASGATSTAGTYTSLEWTMPSVGVPTTYSGAGPFPVTFNKTGTYPLILKGLDAQGCINVVNKNITVNGINADFTAPPVCVGTATTFTCPTAGITSYAWDFGDGATGTGASTTHTYANAGDYTARLTITGGSCTNVFSQNVSVLGATLGITPASPSICNGNSITLNGTALVTGKVSKSKVVTQSTSVPVPRAGSYGVYTDWDGSIGTGTYSALASDVGISNLVVSGLSPTSWKINSICINIVSAKPKYNMIYLETPCGTRIKLVELAMTGSGANFNSACFTTTGSIVIGSAGNQTAPFAGTFAAEELTLWNTNLLGCSNPNGTWKLLVGEYKSASSVNSTIGTWSIDFQTDIPNTLKTLVWSPLTNLTGVAYTGIGTASGTAVATTSTAATITLTATDENNCLSTKDVIITTGGPLPPTTATVNYCQGAAAIPLTATGTSLKWYTDASTGNGSTTAPTPSTSAIGTVHYWVTQSNGSCESARAPLDVIVSAAPTITVNSPTICVGQSATLTAGGATTYSWTGGSTTNPYTVSPTSTTSYTVTETSSGCSSTATATVTVNALPTITVNSPTICIGQTATLTASGGTTYSWTGGPTTVAYDVTPTATSTTYTVTGTTNGCSNTATSTVTIASSLPITVNSPTICVGQSATLTADGATTYSWTGGATTNPYTVSPTVTTNYTVTGTTNGCTGSAIATVTVVTIPIITVNSPTICSGKAATLTAGGATTYSWTGGSTSNPYSVSPTSTTSYTVTGTNSGCSSTATATVTVNTSPTITVNSPTICGGEIATLTAIGGTTYSWTGGSTTNPYIVSPSSTTSYTVTGTTNGCSNTAVATVVVNFTPILTVNSPIICRGETATLIASGGTTYLWSDGGTTSNISVSPTSTTTYTVTSNNGGCISSTTTKVTVNSSPNLIVSNPAEVCQPATIDITKPELIIGSTTGTVINYYSNNIGSIPLTSPNSIRNSGTYYIKSTQYGCSTIVPIIVKVNPKPTANFVPTPPNVTTINPRSIMLNTSLNAVDYSWVFSDGIVSSDVSPEHEFPNTEQSKQVVILIATSDAGCKDTTNKIINVNEEVIYYVPNSFTPDNDDFNQVFKPVFTSGFDPFSYHLYIFNRWGELVFESNDATIGWSGLYGKDGALVQEGSYTWKIDFKLKQNDARKVEVGSVNILK